MKCSEIQLDLSLYSDNVLDESSDLAVRSHIDVCPLCRQRMSDHRAIGDALRSLEVPSMPSTLQNRIKVAIRNEKLEPARILPASDIREWLTMRLMPYCIGFAASVLIGISFLMMMFSGMLKPTNVGARLPGSQSTVLLANSSDPFDETDDPILPLQYANTRLGLGPESPSVNPSGALVALTRSLIKDGMEEDEVVVVADVFSNGLAHIAEVVEPSHDQAAILELQRALQTDPSFAPFVPSNIEARPESVRVVLKLQSVNVSTRETRPARGTSSL